MKAYSHRALAGALLTAVLPQTTAAHAAAFLFGSVEPDLNCTTYLKGILHGSGVHGHNYEQVMPRIERLLHELGGKEEYRLLDWYRLGKLTHFIADAFTYPHNSCFPGDLRAHMRYESQLAVTLRWALCGNPPVDAPLPNGMPLLYWLRQYHERYLQAPMGTENDTRCILTAVRTVTAALTAPCTQTFYTIPERRETVC